MDKPNGGEANLLADVAQALQPLGVRMAFRTPPKGDRADALLTIRIGGRQLRYRAEVKRGLRPATIGAVVHQLRHAGDVRMLVTDYVTPPLADRLLAEGVEFVDAAGNAYIHHPPVVVFVKGRGPIHGEPAAEPGRAFQATGLQVLFAVLARPELVAEPYRAIAAAAGVAHGTVGWVMAEMPRLGYVAEVGGRRRLMNAERLLDQWTQAYARTLRPRLLLGRYRGDVDALAERPPAGVLVGGELAAAHLTRHLRPATATLYAPVLEAATPLALRLKADAEGNIDIRRQFWKFEGEQPGLTPTLLVYADLLAIGDARCLEAAQLLRGPVLDRLV